MGTVSALAVVALLAASAACVALVWLSRETVETMRSLRQLSDETRERLVPLLDKADVTVDAVNAELWRIDGAITRFEEASVRVSVASGTLTEIVQAPAEIVTGVAGRVRRAWKDRRQGGAGVSRQQSQPEETVDGEPEEDAEVAATQVVTEVEELEPERTGTHDEGADTEGAVGHTGLSEDR